MAAARSGPAATGILGVKWVGNDRSRGALSIHVCVVGWRWLELQEFEPKGGG